jgi:hypothetical protein
MRLRTTIALMATGMLATSLSALAESPIDPRQDRRAEPVPIPGGIQIPDGGPLIHVFVPGPESIPGHMGLHVEPSVITNFRGFTAVAFMAGPRLTEAGTPITPSTT